VQVNYDIEINTRFEYIAVFLIYKQVMLYC